MSKITTGVPDAIQHTDNNESDDYVQGWNDCRQAMLAKQSAPATYTCGACGVSMRMEQPEHQDMIGEAQDKLIAEQSAQQEPVKFEQWFSDHGPLMATNFERSAMRAAWNAALANTPQAPKACVQVRIKNENRN